MTLAAGTKVGPYEILSPLGAVGIGGIYRGRNTKVNHGAAFKVLPMPFADDAGWAAAHRGTRAGSPTPITRDQRRSMKGDVKRHNFPWARQPQVFLLSASSPCWAFGGSCVRLPIVGPGHEVRSRERLCEEGHFILP